MSTPVPFGGLYLTNFKGDIVEDGVTDQEYIGTVSLVTLLEGKDPYTENRFWRLRDHDFLCQSFKIPGFDGLPEINIAMEPFPAPSAYKEYEQGQEDRVDNYGSEDRNNEWSQNVEHVGQPIHSDTGSQYLDNVTKQDGATQDGNGLTGGAQQYSEVESIHWSPAAETTSLDDFETLNGHHSLDDEGANSPGLSEKENEPIHLTGQIAEHLQGKVDILAGSMSPPTLPQAEAPNGQVAVEFTNVANLTEGSSHSNSHQSTNAASTAATVAPLFVSEIVVNFTGPIQTTTRGASKSKTTKPRKARAKKQKASPPAPQQQFQVIQWAVPTTAHFQGSSVSLHTPLPASAHAGASSSSSGAIIRAPEAGIHSQGFAPLIGQPAAHPDFFAEWKKLMKPSKAKNLEVDLGAHEFILCGVASHDEDRDFVSEDPETGKQVQTLSITVKCGAKLPRNRDAIIQHVFTVHADKLDSTPGFKKNKCPWGTSCRYLYGLPKLAQHIMEVHVSVKGTGRYCESLKCRLLADGSGDFCTLKDLSACTRTLEWKNVEEEEVEDGEIVDVSDAQEEEGREERFAEEPRLA